MRVDSSWVSLLNPYRKTTPLGQPAAKPKPNVLQQFIRREGNGGEVGFQANRIAEGSEVQKIDFGSTPTGITSGRGSGP